MNHELEQISQGGKIEPKQESAIEYGDNFRLIRVEVDGTWPTRPEYLSDNLSLNELWWCYENAAHIKQEDGYGRGEKVRGVNDETLLRLARDPKLTTYMLSLIKHGPDEYEENNFYRFINQNFLECISLTSDLLFDAKSGLEIVMKKPLKHGWADGQFDYWGNDLRKGLLVVRNSVERISGVRGGTVYIDGNVEFVNEFKGVVYVNGNISHLRNVEEEVVIIVNGAIGDWIMEKSYGASDRRNIPSPFIFAPHPVSVSMKTSGVYGKSMRYWGDDYLDYDEDLKVFSATPKEDLNNWEPEETKSRALKLCQGRTAQVLERLISMVEKAEDICLIIQFWQKFIFGELKGYRRGLHDAPGRYFGGDD